MRALAVAKRVIKQFIGDKRTMALMIVAPMVILWLMSVIFAGDAYKPNIGLVDVPAPLAEKISKDDATLETISKEDAEQALKDQELDAYVAVELTNDKAMPFKLSVKLEGSDPTRNSAVINLLQKTMQAEGTQKPDITFLHGSKDMKTFDSLGSVLIGFFIFFFVFLIAGVAFLRERTRGTLERILATPLKRWELVVGYVIGFGIFTTIQATLISLFAIKVLGIMMNGSVWYLLLITFLLAMVALTLGTAISAFANNELQMIQFIPIVIVPQVFFSGLFNMDAMADWLQKLGYIFPLKYGADAMRNIMIRGEGWDAISLDVFVLVGFSLLFMVLNVFALRKHRRI